MYICMCKKQTAQTCAVRSYCFRISYNIFLFAYFIFIYFICYFSLNANQINCSMWIWFRINIDISISNIVTEYGKCTWKYIIHNYALIYIYFYWFCTHLNFMLINSKGKEWESYALFNISILYIIMLCLRMLVWLMLDIGDGQQLVLTPVECNKGVKYMKRTTEMLLLALTCERNLWNVNNTSD